MGHLPPPNRGAVRTGATDASAPAEMGEWVRRTCPHDNSVVYNIEHPLKAKIQIHVAYFFLFNCW